MMDLHNWSMTMAIRFVDLHNPIIDLHNSIMEIHDSRFNYGSHDSIMDLHNSKYGDT